jgi:D-arabinose 1-dehydrogenase-like Zn-dependent alcohol dehydrogenase
MSLARTMRAVVLTAPHRFEIQDRPVPQAGPEDVVVRVRACGV